METLLEEYALDDDEMGLDFLDGTNISDTSKDTAPNNISDVRVCAFLFISTGWREGLREGKKKGEGLGTPAVFRILECSFGLPFFSPLLSTPLINSLTTWRRWRAAAAAAAAEEEEERAAKPAAAAAAAQARGRSARPPGGAAGRGRRGRRAMSRWNVEENGIEFWPVGRV